jgi:hypothetical protein
VRQKVTPGLLGGRYFCTNPRYAQAAEEKIPDKIAQQKTRGAGIVMGQI